MNGECGEMARLAADAIATTTLSEIQFLKGNLDLQVSKAQNYPNNFEQHLTVCSPIGYDNKRLVNLTTPNCCQCGRYLG
ncbi:MAG: hypothetical protein AB4352_17540 [Hormoscilla sp.]